MKKKKLYGAAAAAHEKKLNSKRAKRSGGEKKMAKKKKRKSTKRASGRRSRGKSRQFLTRNQALAALGVATGYGYLQHRAEKSKSDEMTFFKEAPTVTPLGRAGTVAAVAGGVAYATGGTVSKVAKVIAVGMGCVALAQFGRRGFEPYTDKDTKAIMAGEDEADMYLAGGTFAGGDDDEDTISGELDLVEYG